MLRFQEDGKVLTIYKAGSLTREKMLIANALGKGWDDIWESFLGNEGSVLWNYVQSDAMVARGRGTSDYNVRSYSNCLLGIFSLGTFLDSGITEKTYREHEIIVAESLPLGHCPVLHTAQQGRSKEEAEFPLHS